MKNYEALTIESFAIDLEERFERVFGLAGEKYRGFLAWACRMSLDRIRNCDMLYHNVDHTIMVTVAGQEILMGKQLCDGGIQPRDWIEFTVATLCHDIGYVRGVCKDDRNGSYITTGPNDSIEIPQHGTDVELTPFHVDRGKRFVIERFGGDLLVKLSAETIAGYIEKTRFPPSETDPNKDRWDSLGDLVRAADLIGQLADPGYLRKVPALYYEFEALGLNEKLGYDSPCQMRELYSGFYWKTIDRYVADAIRYLDATQSGRQWVANLYAHVFRVEHRAGNGKESPSEN